MEITESRKYETIVRLLICYGVNTYCNNDKKVAALFEAIVQDNLPLAELLLKRGTHSTSRLTLSELMSYAITRRNQAIFRLLLQGGAAISLKERYGYAALHMAIVALDERIIELLLRIEAIAKLRGDKGLSPLAWAVCNTFWKAPVVGMLRNGERLTEFELRNYGDLELLFRREGQK